MLCAYPDIRLHDLWMLMMDVDYDDDVDGWMMAVDYHGC